MQKKEKKQKLWLTFTLKMFKNLQSFVCVYYKSEQQQQQYEEGVNYAMCECVCVYICAGAFNDDNELEASIKDNKGKS